METFVLLAAGRSERMGTPKGLLPWGGTTWLQAQAAAARAQGAARVIVVLGRDAAAYEGRLEGLEACVNPDPDRGPFSSLQTALEGLEGPVFASPVDTPVAPVLDALRGALGAHDAAVPTFEGRGGHPVLLSAAFAARLRDLDPGSRLDHLLRAADTVRVPVDDPRIRLNLNTPEAWRAFKDGSRL